MSDNRCMDTQAQFSPAFRSRTFWLLVFLVVTNSAFACPACTYERMLQSNWHFKMFAVQIATALAFTVNRLDFIRVLYTFIPVAVINIQLHTMTMWYGHPAMRLPGVSGILLMIGAWALALNLGGAAIMYAIGTLRFYRRDKARGLPVWQAVAYAVTLLVANVIFWQF